MRAIPSTYANRMKPTTSSDCFLKIDGDGMSKQRAIHLELGMTHDGASVPCKSFS